MAKDPTSPFCSSSPERPSARASWPRRLALVTAGMADDQTDRLAEGFSLGAAALQQIRRDPLLPPELAGEGWPGQGLRDTYRAYQLAFAAAVRAWFSAARRDG